MKSIIEKINESLYTYTPGTGFDECDGFTREYNNLFANMSGTLLRKVDVIIDRPVYVLTGSIIRSGCDFLYNRDIAVTTYGGFMTPNEFLNDRGYCIYDIDGSKCCCGSCVNANSTETTEDFLDPIIVSAVSDMIDDLDYLIIA